MISLGSFSVRRIGVRKFISYIIVVTALLCFTLPSFSVCAKTVHKNTISLIGVRANKEGTGYKWNNYDDILTLDGLNIQTSDEYGLKIKDGATVILNGENYIKAKTAAIFIEGKVIFKGSGKLTLIGENGIYCSSSDTTDTLTVNGGKYVINSTKEGIISSYHKITITKSVFNINSESGTAIEGEKVSIGVGSKITANASIIGHDKLSFEGADVNVTSQTAAFVSDSSITFKALTIKAGDTKDSLSSADTYENQNCVKLTSTYDGSKKSVLFGSKFGAVTDVLALLGAGVILGCTIALPIIIKKKKTKAAVEKRDKEQNEKKSKKQK